MPAKKHDFTVTEIKAGLLVIASVVIAGIFVATVKGIRKPDDKKTYYVSFKDTGGLNNNADVRWGGKKVGFVSAIGFDPKDQSNLRVEAKVDPEIPVNAGSEAFITQITLTAEKHLEIMTGEKDAKRLADGAEIKSIPGGLFDQAGKVAQSIQQTLEDVKEMMGVGEALAKEEQGDGEMTTLMTVVDDVHVALCDGADLVSDVRKVVYDRQEDVEVIMAKVKEVEDSATGLIEEVRGMLGENRESIKQTAEGVGKIIEDVTPFIEHVAGMTEELDNLAASFQEILDNAESLSAEAQDLLGDNRAAIEDIVLDLRESIRHLKEFMRTMSEQPQAVIRGKSPEGRK